jgi:hypothetical protein
LLKNKKPFTKRIDHENKNCQDPLSPQDIRNHLLIETPINRHKLLDRRSSFEVTFSIQDMLARNILGINQLSADVQKDFVKRFMRENADFVENFLKRR